MLILGLLRKQSMHGYQLMDLVDRVLSSCSDLKKPTAYFLLDKMEKAGWITSATVQEGKRPAKKVYQLTNMGEVSYQAFLRQNLAEYTQPAFPGDIGIIFVDGLEPVEAVSLLQQRKHLMAARMEEMLQTPIHQGGAQWVLEHQRRFLELEINWVDELIDRLMQHPVGIDYLRD